MQKTIIDHREEGIEIDRKRLNDQLIEIENLTNRVELAKKTIASRDDGGCTDKKILEISREYGEKIEYGDIGAIQRRREKNM